MDCCCDCLADACCVFIRYCAIPALNAAMEVLGGNLRGLDAPMSAPQFKDLELFFKKVRVQTIQGLSGGSRWPRGKSITGLVAHGGEYVFHANDGETTVSVSVCDIANNVKGLPSVLHIQDYMLSKHSYQVQHPKAIGVKIKDAVFPIETVVIVPGQIYRKKLKENEQRGFLRESETRPEARLERICRAVSGPVRPLLKFTK